MSDEAHPQAEEQPSGISWGAMLLILLLALAVASAVAWWLIFPFFHRHS